MIAEHKLVRQPPADPSDWGAAAALIPLARRNADGLVRPSWSDLAGKGHNAILCGPLEAHAAFASAFGGPEWHLALEIMAEVAARSTDAQVAEEFRLMIDEVTG